MQARAILEAVAELTKEGIKVFPEIMIPLVGTVSEFVHQENIVRQIAEEISQESGF